MKPTRRDSDVWQLPSAWFVAPVRELKLGQAQHFVAGVVQFQPVAAAALVVQHPAAVGGEDFVNAKRMRRGGRLGLGMDGGRPNQKKE